MMYVVKMMNGDRHKLTEEQLKKLVLGDGMCVLQSGEGIQKSRVENFFPETMQSQIEEKKELQTGRLHDGTRVKKHFGQWVGENQVVDDKGNYVPVRMDPNYYPEVAMDCVASNAEFEAMKELPAPERLQKMLGGKEVKKISNGEGLSRLSFNE